MDPGNRIFSIRTAFVTNSHIQPCYGETRHVTGEIAMLGAHCTIPTWTLQLLESPPWTFALHFTHSGPHHTKLSFRPVLTVKFLGM
jgi:hypothetical protein